jgi:hypothetical protein
MFDLFVTGDLVRKQVGRQFEPETARNGPTAEASRRQRRRPHREGRVLRVLASVLR